MMAIFEWFICHISKGITPIIGFLNTFADMDISFIGGRQSTKKGWESSLIYAPKPVNLT